MLQIVSKKNAAALDWNLQEILFNEVNIMLLVYSCFVDEKLLNVYKIKLKLFIK